MLSPENLKRILASVVDGARVGKSLSALPAGDGLRYLR